jgi:hypothetical protein
MASLHGILAELGIENPLMHPEREPAHAHAWVVDEEFIPLIGNSYELAFGRIAFGGEDKPLIKRVRIDGPGEWFDLDTQAPVDRVLLAQPVKAFRLLE